MEHPDIKKLRIKQVVSMNILYIVCFTALFVVVNTYGLTLQGLFLIVAILVLLQTVMIIIRMKSSRIIIPIIDEAVQYEKMKMGNEWFKQQRVGITMNLFYSAFLFFMVFIQPSSPATPINLSSLDYSVIIAFTLLIINLSMIMHIRKVDRSAAPADLRGYTMKTTFMAVLAGIGMAAAVMIFVFMRVLSQI
jgi:hypothetical protein